MNQSKLQVHVEQLKKRHNALDTELNKLVNTHGPEDRIHELKVEKLRLKDEITKYELQSGN